MDASQKDRISTRLASLLPRAHDYHGVQRHWRSDLVGGITVGIVALPLALAFGVTSGLGAAAGLVTAIVAGIVAGVFGGSNLQVSGPTGAMTVVLIPIVARFGHQGVLAVALGAGLLLIAAGAAGLGRYVSLVPWPVIEGFTAGIAIIIFLQQVPSALGIPKPEGENAVAVALRALTRIGSAELAAVGICVLAVVFMLVLPHLHRSLPASLIAVAAATVLAQLAHLGIDRIGQIPSSLPRPHLPTLQLASLGALIGPAFAVAALAGLESLLSATVADGMVDGEDHDPDRELFGQGLANVAVSFFGGMPATGAIARTAVNVRAGSRTRLAAIFHGVVLTLVVLLLAQVVGVIPLAALAGILMVTAVRMVEFGSIGRLLRSTRSDALVLAATTVTTLAFDLVVAVGVGVVLASVLTLRKVAQATSFQQVPVVADIDEDQEHDLLAQHIVTYRIDGALFFGASQRFLMELADVTDVRVVILRLGQLQVLDATGAVALGDIVTHLSRRGITVLLCSVSDAHARVLSQVGSLDALAHESHLFPTIDQALPHARVHATRGHEADA